MVQSALDAQKIIGQVTALAMADATFKTRLTDEPLTVLREHGLDLPATLPDVQIKVLNSFDEVPDDADASTLHLVIPDASELSHEELSLVAGAKASCDSTASTCFTIPSCISCASSASTKSCS